VAYLEHPWIREDGEASDKPIDSAVLSRMKQFRAMNKLKKLALKVYTSRNLHTWISIFNVIVTMCIYETWIVYLNKLFWDAQ
jgi:hypothetical protein